MEKYDVCIIGGGVLGCLIAMELSKQPLSVILAEKNGDTCLEISKANTAVLYPGYDQKPGTLKSRFTIEGNRRTAEVCEELGVPVLRCGSLMAATGDAGKSVLLKKYRKGTDCHIPGLRMLDREESLRLEPCLSPAVTASLFAQSTAVIYPWRLGMAAIRLAEKAGVTVRLHTKICGIRKNTNSGEEYLLTTEDGTDLHVSCVINAAGIHAHQIRELLFPPKIRIRPSMADYLIFGREENPGLSHVVFYEPEDGKKGITLVPNLNGTLLLGTTDRALPPGIYSRRFSSSPNSTDNLQTARVTDTGTTFLSPDPSNSLQTAHSTDTGTTFSSPDPSTSQQTAHAADTETIFIEPEHATDRAGLQFLQNLSREICPVLADAVPIRCFAGVRPNPYETIPDGQGGYCDSGRSIHTFIIEKETPDGSFISLLGIKTPGITASVPIAEYVAGIAVQSFLNRRPAFRNITDIRTSGGSVLPETPLMQADSIPEEPVLTDSAHKATVWEDPEVADAALEPPARQVPILRTAIRDLPLSERARFAEQDPSYGKVICRCEQVTEGEIREAVRNGATTVEGVKLRCGAGMGRCQGTRCRCAVEALLKETGKVPQIKDSVHPQEFVQKFLQKSSQKFVQGFPQNLGQEFPRSPVQDLTCDYLLIGAGAAGLSLAAELAAQDPSASIALADRETYPGGVLIQCLHEGFPAPQPDRSSLSQNQYLSEGFPAPQPDRSSLSQNQYLSEGFPENQPGRMISGPDYLNLLWEEVQGDIRAGRIRCLFGTDVTDIEEHSDDALHPIHAVAAAGGAWIRIRTGCIALTCGAIERTSGMLRIPGTRPQGIYTAGEIQKMLHLENRLPGKRAVLVGSGNMGLIMADLMLRKGMDVVRILEKEDHVTASAWNIKKYLADPESLIRPDRILFQHEVGCIYGSPKLVSISVRRSDQHTERQTTGDAADHIACEAVERPVCKAENHISCDAENRIDCDTLVLAAGLLPDRQLLTDSGLSPSSGTGKRIFSFGNCEHIYSIVTAIRLDAKQVAKNMIRARSDSTS